VDRCRDLSERPDNVTHVIDGEFSDERLREAAAAAGCMTEFLRLLQVTPTANSRRRMEERLRRLGVERDWRRSPTHYYSREQLEDAVRQAKSYAAVIRILGRPQAGGTQSYIARRIRAEGIDTSHFTGSRHNAGKQQPRLTANKILVLLPVGSARRKTHQLRRALREKGVPDVCDDCGLKPSWQGRRLTLIIEHRNGNWLDNRLGNLRLLCPNCHSQTATWCRRKGS
jgi:hypothetical protein